MKVWKCNLLSFFSVHLVVCWGRLIVLFPLHVQEITSLSLSSLLLVWNLLKVQLALLCRQFVFIFLQLLKIFLFIFDILLYHCTVPGWDLFLIIPVSTWYMFSIREFSFWFWNQLSHHLNIAQWILYPYYFLYSILEFLLHICFNHSICSPCHNYSFIFSISLSPCAAF